MYRDHNCGELNIKNVNEEVMLAGWVQRIRNLGEIEFVDLRDEKGITQLVISNDLKETMNEVTPESVISVKGTVKERSNKNPKMPTGDIEIIVSNLEILGQCKSTLPFEINSEKIDIANVREDLRLQYRYLDLRNEKIHNNILLRSKIMKSIRKYMDELGFTEIQTPILANSSPEGARDYLVPSRLHAGKFYALPQAPQQFKQLLMCSGFDKYYQIAPCFRDEDPRADRAPGEFYQLDFEMAFATQDDVFEVAEQVLPKVYKEHTNWTVDEGPFVRIPYKEAMEKYGIDKPDLRNPLIIKDATELFANTEFNAFKDKTIKVIIVPKGAEQGRKFFDDMTEFAVNEAGAKGLAWVKIDEENNLTGGISKFVTDEIKTEIGAKAGDSIFFIADELSKAQKIAGLVRIELGKRLDLLEKNVYKFCWIVDFPMYEYNEDEEKIDFSHNPFSMPQGGLDALNTKDPLDILAYQYDLVCNGYEVSSGAVRNHDPKTMVKAFEIAGYTEDDVKSKFGALYTAFQYGTPPHAGCAPGLDRMVMLIADSDNIREVIAFPKNKKARDVMMNAPSVVTDEQLKDVHISVTEKEEEE